MKKVLVAFDGSPSSSRALRFVLEQAPASKPNEIHVLNVQLPPQQADFAAGRVAPGLHRGSIAEARLALDPAEAMLADSGIPFQTHIRFGNVEQSIVDQAADLGCDQIVMSTRGAGAIKGWILGSVAMKVLHLATIPVTLVK